MSLKQMIFCITSFCALLVVLKAQEINPTFINKPIATKEGSQTKITFSVSKQTDVEIAILDINLNIINHLAAGVLGATNPPPTPLMPGLSQTIYWDGKTDSGKIAEGGPFKVRVRIGIKPQFDSFLLDNPIATGRVTAIAIGPKGKLYLWHRDVTANEFQGSNKLKVLNRDMTYDRTIIPFPANLSKEKLKAFHAFTTAQGEPIPRIFNMQQVSFYYEGKGSRSRTMSDNCTPTVDAKGRAYWIVSGGRLAAVEEDGSAVYDTFLSEPIFEDLKFLYGDTTLCTGSNGELIYIAGIAKADDAYKKNLTNLPCVFRLNTKTRKAEVFAGNIKEPGTEKAKFMIPRGLAAANGLLYVADGPADRIVVLKESDASFVGEIKIKNPQSIAVDPKSGFIYVCIYKEKGKAELIKLNSYENPKEIIRLPLPDTYEYGTHRISLDATNSPVRIYLPTLRWRSGEIYCYEDLGEKFNILNDPRDLKKPWASGPRDLTVDRNRNELYVKYGNQSYYRINIKSNALINNIKLTGDNAAGTQLVAAPDSSLITLSWGQNTGIRRLDRDGKPMNWKDKDTNIIKYCGVMTFMQRYLAVPNSEDLYMILPAAYRTEKDENGQGDYSSLNVLGFDGKTKRTIIWQCSVGAVPRVDAKGNIYLAEMLKPIDRSYPEFFDDKFGKILSNVTQNIDGEAMANNIDLMSKFWESNIYGSIIKFPPSGGVIWYKKDLPACVEGAPSSELLAKPKSTYLKHIGYDISPVEVQGAEWVRFGFSPYSISRGAGFCMCEGVGFDVDSYGRVFYPNLGQFRIEMVDNNNNYIGDFGKYGNTDSGGKSAKVSTPEIPLAWPTYVAVSDDFAFINDTISSRVVKVKLSATEEIISDIK